MLNYRIFRLFQEIFKLLPGLSHFSWQGSSRRAFPRQHQVGALPQQCKDPGSPSSTSSCWALLVLTAFDRFTAGLCKQQQHQWRRLLSPHFVFFAFHSFHEEISLAGWFYSPEVLSITFISCRRFPALVSAATKFCIAAIFLALGGSGSSMVQLSLGAKQVHVYVYVKSHEHVHVHEFTQYKFMFMFMYFV